MKKKLFLLFSMAVLIIPSLESNIKASQTQTKDYNYFKLKKEGIIGSDIKLNEWIKLSEQNKEAEKKLLSQKEVNVRGGFTAKAGDIIITNGTSSWGMTGHAAIFLAKDKVFQISGMGSYTTTWSWKNYYRDYVKKKPKDTWLKVYRSKNASIGAKAVKWIKKQSNYGTHKYGYGFTTNLAQKNPTYCSKIPWQAYYYDNKKAVNYPGGNLAFPYKLPDYFKSSYKIKVVKTYWGEGKK